MLSGSDRDSEVVRSIYILALVSSFLFGFAIMSAGPIGFQYAAEVIHPASESISQGMLLLVGQISGIVFTAGMSIRNKAFIDGFMTLFFFLAIAVLIFDLFHEGIADDRHRKGKIRKLSDITLRRGRVRLTFPCPTSRRSPESCSP